MRYPSPAGKVFHSLLLLVSKAYERLGGNCLVVQAKTWWNGAMLVTLPEPASVQIFLEGQMDPNLTDFLCHTLKSGQVFVDVGAHLGYFSLLAGRLVGPSGHVLAFEPAPETFALLERNIAFTEAIRAYPLALWSKEARTHPRDSVSAKS